MQDFGLAIAQWVSALETLLWPLQRGARQELSIDFMGGMTWEDSRLSHRRFRVKLGQKVIAATAAQKALALMYRARIAFLHGLRVTPRHLVPFTKRPQATLAMIAAVIFRTALVARLSELFPERRDPFHPELIASWLSGDVFEEALLAFFGIGTD